MMDERGDYLRIRRLRKKLRQIELLEQLNRSLNDEETAKVVKKGEFRKELKAMLKHLPANPNQDAIPTAVIVSPDEDEGFDANDTSGELNISASNIEADNELNLMKEELVINNEHKKQHEPASVKRSREERDEQARSSPVPTIPKKLKAETKQEVNLKPPEARSLQRIWRASEFTVQQLDGHHDAITAVAADGNIIVTASRDTTVKVWNPDKTTEPEIFSLRGHRGVVTCLILLSKSDSDELSRYLGLVGSHRLAVSGANDSSMILWSVTSGELKKSIYTFNTVTCVAYMQSEVCFITATDGGKLQIWDAVSCSLARSLTAYDDGYTCMKTLGTFLFTASLEGIIQVWEVIDRNLSQRFSMDDLDLPPGSEVILRTVRCMEVYDDWVFYGDDGPNVKAFNWKTKEIKKFSNHVCEWGTTDAVVCNGQEIIAASYNLDEAKGHFNVRLYPGGHYMCSLDDGETGRICCIALTPTGFGNIRIVTGGSTLKVWDIYQPPFAGRRNQGTEKLVHKPTCIDFYDKEAINSDYESSGESSASEREFGKGVHVRTYIPQEITENASLWSYCNIL